MLNDKSDKNVKYMIKKNKINKFRRSWIILLIIYHSQFKNRLILLIVGDGYQMYLILNCQTIYIL